MNNINKFAVFVEIYKEFDMATKKGCPLGTASLQNIIEYLFFVIEL